ncbi:hypothetical protein [Bacillus altitudinis]|uniref:hypothetical protein n=1 Tax=Bacillus altitudinis TaxID=293387 RepID=UPI00119F9ACC|nr:hypothetical protein [Bacillus altitudinis]
MKVGNKRLEMGIEEGIMRVGKNKVWSLGKEGIGIGSNNNGMEIKSVNWIVKGGVMLGGKGEKNGNVNKMGVGIVGGNVLDILR